MFDNFSPPQVLTLIGGLLAAVGVYLSARNDDARQTVIEKERASFQEQLRLKSNEIVRLTKENYAALDTFAKERAAFERQLREKSDEIVELTKENKATLTGGDGYPRIFIRALEPYGESSGPMLFVYIMNEGRYPLSEVHVSLFDPTETTKLNKASEMIIEGTKVYYRGLKPEDAHLNMNFEIGRMAPETNVRREISLPKGKTNICYYGMTSALNGRTVQKFRFVLLRQSSADIGHFASAWQIRSIPIGEPSDKGKIVLEHVDEDFPRNERGEVEWGPQLVRNGIVFQ